MARKTTITIYSRKRCDRAGIDDDGYPYGPIPEPWKNTPIGKWLVITEHKEDVHNG